MTRCSYIPPEGQSVIAMAKERGGATDGDIAALVDRFGCRAEATHHAFQDEGDGDVHACADHLGHLIEGDHWTCQCGGRPFKAAFTPMPLPTPQTVGVVRSPAAAPVDDDWSSATPYATDDHVTSGGAAWRVERSSIRTATKAISPPRITPTSDPRIVATKPAAADDEAFRAWRAAAADPPMVPSDGRAGVGEMIGCLGPVRSATGVGCFSSVDMRPANRPTDENTTCPATFGGSAHT